MKKFLKNYKFLFILIISIIVGSILGLILGENTKYIKPFGDIFLNMLYVIVVPLVFFTISSSISKFKNYKKLGKIMGMMLIMFILTSLIAVLFMLIGVNIFNISSSNIVLSDYTKESIDLGSKIVDMVTVGDFYLLFSKSNMLPLIIFSVVFGIAINKSKEEKITKALISLTNVCMKLIKIVMYYAPIGLCAYFADLVSVYGKEILGDYAKSMIFYYIMALIYYIIFYTIYIKLSKRNIKETHKKLIIPTITGFGTCSSLASLPTNLECAKELDIEEDIYDITLPIGSTIHMEGSAMASILKIAFLFSVFGKSFNSPYVIIVAIIISLLSGVVMSGIPGGGLIGEMLIVSLYGFPASAFPLIATIGWIIDPPATALNVAGDITSSLLIEKQLE